MAMDLLTLPAVENSRATPAARADLAVAALPLLVRLRDTLLDAIRFRDACRQLERHANRRWAVPPLFFFDATAQSRWDIIRPVRPTFPDPWAENVAESDPVAAYAWNKLPDLLDDTLSLCGACANVRHAARAVPGLTRAATRLATDHRRVKQFADILAVPDDAVVVAVDPEAGSGLRVILRGVARVGQLHRLLADAFWADSDTASRFQLYRPAALGSDGRVRDGVSGIGDCLWPGDLLSDIPAEKGERIVLLGRSPFPCHFDTIDHTSLIDEELDILEVMSREAVGRWLEHRVGTGISPLTSRQMRAATMAA